ncbi:MAG: hypothetical protein Q4G63_04245 [Bacteroidia bacterium]|nr:hypothetical protein [Bacteroidia bacterium]
MISIDTATDIIGTLKALKIQGKIEFPEAMEILDLEENLLYRISGTTEEQNTAYKRVQDYYAPLLKNYYEQFNPHRCREVV